MKELERALRPVKRRMRAQRTFIWAMYGIFAAAVGVLLLRAASFLWTFPTAAQWGAAVLIAVPALFALVSWLWPITALDAARQADAMGLEARAQTAVMLDGCDTPMASLQRSDALQSLDALEPARHMALRPPRLAWIGVLACAALFGASYLIPNPQAQALKAREQFHSEMAGQAQKVDEGAAKLDASAAETPELRRLLGELSRELRVASGSRDALTAVDAAEREMTAMEARTAKDALAAMRSAGLEALAQALEKSDAQAVREWLEASEGARQALAKAAAAASNATAQQLLQAAAQAMADGSAAQAADALRGAATGQTAASAQALALAGMVRGAAARAGAQGQAALQGASGAQGAAAGRGDQAGGGAGQGTSSRDGGVTASQRANGSQGAAAPEKKVAEYESIYDPTRLGGAGDVHSERGRLGEGEIVESEAGKGAGSLDGSVPYRQVLPEYSRAAADAARDADLPAYARQWVEDYFNALAQ